MTERIPVERLAVGDVVRAIEHGPQGTVIDADRRGWTLVRYRAVVPYKHGKDRLMLLSPSRPVVSGPNHSGSL